MNLIGLLLIALMGANDWQYREMGTQWFDWCCENDLLPYEIEKAAFEHKDLEIQHRARKVLRNYYVVDDHDNIDITYRQVLTTTQFENFNAWVERKEKEGWRLSVWWAGDGATTKCRFIRIKK